MKGSHPLCNNSNTTAQLSYSSACEGSPFDLILYHNALVHCSGLICHFDSLTPLLIVFVQLYDIKFDYAA